MNLKSDLIPYNLDLENLVNNIPEYAQDLNSNFYSFVLHDNNVISRKQTAIIAIASAITTKNVSLSSIISAYFKNVIDEKELKGAKAAAAIMGMTNIYYRLQDTIPKYSSMNSELKMSILKNHNIDSIDFHMACLAVSIINSCHYCIKVHNDNLIKNNVSEKGIQMCVQIASIIHGLSCIQEVQDLSYP